MVINGVPVYRYPPPSLVRCMPALDPDLHFLLETVDDCPNAHAIRVCPLSSYRALKDEVQHETLSALTEPERRQLVRHCTYCIRFYGLAQHL